MTSTSTDADEPEDDSINQIPFEESGCFKGGYASINAAPDAGTAVADATGDCETVANSTFEAVVAPEDGVVEDLDLKSGLRRLNAEQPANVQTGEFEPTSKSAEVDHEGALRSFGQVLHTRVFGLGVCWKFLRRSRRFNSNNCHQRLPPTRDKGSSMQTTPKLSLPPLH